MKFGFAWRVKGIRPIARETAREAARRAGLPLNEWLNTVILQQAVEQGMKGPSRAPGEDATYSGQFSELHQRLDELTRRVDEVTRTGSAAYAPKRGREEIDQFVDTPRSPAANQTTPGTYLPPGLDRAVAEFSTRRRALNGELAPSNPQTVPALAAAPAPAPSQSLSDLEDQLRRITDRIETLQRPGVEEAIDALRAELGDIGRALNEAMPRRTLESIEKQIQDLTQRIAESRQAGVDGSTLTGIEHSLAEVRDTLRELTPAESLIGYNEAINALAHRIDLIVAERDPATMQQLDRSIATLREMAAHVASNETVSNLAAQVRTLADKIEHVAVDRSASTTLNNLENRVGELSRALAERARNGDAVPSRLEAMVQSLSDKIEQLHQTRGSPVALDHLEDRIVALMERLDASNSRLGHLEAIERGLTDLLVQIEDIRTAKENVRLRAESSPSIDVLKQGIANTQDTLEAMRGMLGHVVDRLATMEKDVRGERQWSVALESDFLELTEPVGRVSVNTATAAPETPPSLLATAPLQTPAPVSAPLAPTAEPQLAVAPKRMPPAGHTAADRESSPDQPLEPGSGPPRFGSHPGAHIAASEAALGARPSPSTPTSKSSFIAAARRAAQAAGQDSRGRPSRPPPLENGNKGATLHTKVVTRVKSLFLAASIVAIIVGSIQFAGNVFDFSIFDTNDAKIAKNFATDSANSDFTAASTGVESADTLAVEQAETPSPAAIAPPAPTADINIAANLLAPSALPGLTPPAPKTGAAAIPAPLSLNQAMQGSPALLNPPALNAPPLGSAGESKSDVTGSVTRRPAEASTPRQPAWSAQPTQLPVAIGGPRLRNAASNGDASAAYQVAVRYAEGRGVPANLEEAANWFERAASKGLAPAQFRYASMLEKGLGVKKDLGAARKLYIAAAAKGHAKAMHNLAVVYAEGADGKPDYANAAQWFRKAAERGVADSQYNLGVLTARGLGTGKNIAESYKWFALAAAQGDPEAARKRDELAAHLDAQTLAAVQQEVKSFVAEAQPAEATVVPEPPGGWDRATTPPARERSRAAGPLSISAFHSGKL
jgi:localization factor PodJL